MSTSLRVVTVVAALGCGLNAGVFFAFSTFVMSGLRRLPAGQATATMRSINVTAVRPPLMLALFGTAAVCVYIAVNGALELDRSRGVLSLIGSGTFLLGAIVVTAAVNVPLNNALAAVDPEPDSTERQWAAFERPWTRANHVRTLSSLGAATLLTVAALA